MIDDERTECIKGEEKRGKEDGRKKDLQAKEDRENK